MVIVIGIAEQTEIETEIVYLIDVIELTRKNKEGASEVF
jgi:hypothetical protein